MCLVQHVVSDRLAKLLGGRYETAIRYNLTDIDPKSFRLVVSLSGDLDQALHEKWAYTLFSVQPLCALCLCGCFFLSNNEPQRHRAHRGCTEKKPNRDFSCKAP